MLRASRNSSGFSLIEVLAALFILGFALTAAIGLISGSLKEIRKAEDHALATVHARSLLDEAMALEGVDGIDGDIELDGRFSGWREVSELSREGDVMVYEIRVTVDWGTSGRVVLTGRKAVTELE